MNLSRLSGRIVCSLGIGLGSFFLTPSAGASVIGAFWAFQPATNTAPDSAGPPYVTVNAETFNGTPTLAATGSVASPRSFASPLPGNYTDFEGTTWQAGRNMGWDSGSMGNTFTVTLDTTNVKDLQLRFDYRSTTGGITAFTGLAYSLDGGTTFTPIASVPGFTANSTWNVYTHDLSATDAIENKSSVILRWTLPTITSGTSFRMDNLEITGTLIPEPGTLALAGIGLTLLLARGRRRGA
jgi:hypothetical protein